MSPVAWAKLGAGVVLALLVWFGYQAIRDSGVDAGKAQGAAERASLALELAHAREQAATCAASLERINTETARGLAEAERRAAAGERAANQAEAAAHAAEQARKQAANALAKAKREPICKAQLEQELCPDIPLL